MKGEQREPGIFYHDMKRVMDELKEEREKNGEMVEIERIAKLLNDFIEKDQEFRLKNPVVDRIVIWQAVQDRHRASPNFKKDPYGVGKQMKKEVECELYKKVEQRSRELLQEVFDFLDGLDIWQSKFTTEYNEEFAREGEEADSAKDSVYYMTPNGMSLRFKMSELQERGLAGTIKKFCEKIFFISDDFHDFKEFESGKPVDAKKVSEVPVEGSRVYEYVSREFYGLQKQKSDLKDFYSEIKTTRDRGGLSIAPVLSTYLDHKGHKVNGIEFLKKK